MGYKINGVAVNPALLELVGFFQTTVLQADAVSLTGDFLYCCLTLRRLTCHWKTSYRGSAAVKICSRMLISNFRRVMNVVCFLLGDSPAPEIYMPTFRNTLSVPSS